MQLYAEITIPNPASLFDTVRRVDPVGMADWTFVSEQQEGEIFHRTKLNGNLTLVGEDYTWLYEHWKLISCCAEIHLNIYTPDCDGQGQQLFWPGYFSISALKWNHTDCKAEVTQVNVSDTYDALFRVWAKPKNIIPSLGFVPFVAEYPDKYTYDFDEQGRTVRKLPDGNAPTITPGLPSRGAHPYRGLPFLYTLGQLLWNTTIGSKADPIGHFGDGIISDFYSAAINPVSKRTNFTKVLVPGSDAKRPASVPATVFMISLKEILDDLKSLHNVWWFIEPETRKLRIEHLSWFPPRSYGALKPVTLNLTRYPDALKAADNESFDLDSLYGKERLLITGNQKSTYPEFYQGNVIYDDACTVKDEDGKVKVNTLTVSRIYTDLLAGYLQPDSVADSALLLVDLEPNTETAGYSRRVITTGSLLPALDFGFIPGNTTTPDPFRLNGYQMAAELFQTFHRHGRSYAVGVMNQLGEGDFDAGVTLGTQVAMASVKPTRRQEGITIPVCCQDLPLNLSGFIRTNRFSSGELAKAVFDPLGEVLTLDVWGESRCAAVQTLPSDPGMPPDTGGPTTPGGQCPAIGTLIRTRNEHQYCADGVTETSYTTIFVNNDGNCGEYEITIGPFFLKSCT